MAIWEATGVVGEAGERTRQVAGVEIVSRRSGSGPPIVVLHRSVGLLQTPVLPVLAERHELIVPDLPGFGRSGCPPWARDVRDLAILLGLWLDAEALGPVAIVGLGFGGWVAAELATLSPARLEALVLVGAAGLLPREGRIADQMLVSHTRYVQAHFSDAEQFERIFGAEIDDDTLLAWEINREMTTRVAWKPYMYNRRLEPLLTEVSVPALVVWGADDAIVPLECGLRLADLLPGAALHVLEGCGHAVEIERPEQLSDLILAHVVTRKVA